MSCTVQTYFSENNLIIRNQVSGLLTRLVKEGFTKNETYVYNEMIDWLKNLLGAFLFPTKTTRGDNSIRELQLFLVDRLEAMRSAYAKYGKTREVGIIKKIIKQFSDKLFLLDGNVKEENVQPIEVTSEQQTKGSGALTEEEKLWVGISNLQKQAYGTAISAKIFRQTLFERDIVKALIIDIENRTITTDNISLNINIGNLKEKYYKQLLRFMNLVKSDNTYSNSMYVNGRIVNNYETLLSDFLEYLRQRQKEDPEGYFTEIGSGWRATISSKSNGDTLYEAVNAYVNLAYFDSLLKTTLGKVVSIDANFMGTEVDLDFSKYAFGETLNNMAKGWETLENRSALEEMGRFSKLLILSIPLYEKSSGKFLNSNISLVGFINAFTNLQLAVIQTNSTMGLSGKGGILLLNDILDNHKDPGVTIPDALRFLMTADSNNYSVLNILKLNGLNDYDLNILYSVYKYCFQGRNSIAGIENGYKTDHYTLIDCILGTIDRSVQVDYLESLAGTDGITIVLIKNKFHSRQKEYNLRNGINKLLSNRDTNTRKDLLKKYKVRQNIPGSHKEYTFTINNNVYTITTQSDYGILGARHDDTTIRRNGSIVHFDNLVSLSSLNTIDRLLANDNLNDDEKAYRDILLFIQDLTGLLKLLTPLGLNKLLILLNLTDDSVSLLLISAVLAAVTNELYYNYSQIENPTLTFEDYVLDEYQLLHGLSTKEKPFYFAQGLGTKDLTPIKISDDWINYYVMAEAILSGEVSKAVTKDIFGNSIANYSTAYLGANIFYYMKKYKGSDTAVSSLFFQDKPEFIQGTVVNNDFQNRAGDKKNVKTLKTGELLYTHIIDSFWGLQKMDSTRTPARAKKLENKWIILPTTYADKTKIVEYIINPDRVITTTKFDRSYNGKSLRQLTSDETALLYVDTVGDYYKHILSALVDKFQKLFPELFPTKYTSVFLEGRYSSVNANKYVKIISTELDRLNNLSMEELNREASEKYGISKVKNVEDYLNKLAQLRGIHNFELDTTYRVNKKGLVLFNELLDHYANYLYTEAHFKEKLQLERANFLNSLLRENISFYTRFLDKLTEITKVGAIIDYMFTDKRTKKINEEKRTDYYKNWVKDGRLILGKIISENGEVIDVLQGSPIAEGSNVILNPLLEEYYIKDSFISNNLRLSLTGSEIAHMAKVNMTFSPLDKGKKGYYLNMREIECAALGALLKRNVIIPATLQYLTLNTLIGAPPRFKVAVIRDLRAAVNNFRGDNKTIDSQDGSAKVTAFTAILENNSLQDLAVGVDRKPIWHHYDPTTGTATLLKFATNTMTNERMLQSLDSDLDLYNLFKRMTNLRWHTETGEVNLKIFDRKVESINLLHRDYNSNELFDFLKHILLGSKLFYKEGGSIREIVGFGREIVGNQLVYYTEEIPVDLNGNRYSSTPTRVYQLFDSDSNLVRVPKKNLEKTLPNLANYHTIDSLFELHLSLGGIYSVELNLDKQFVRSESSNYAVVGFMNYVSIRTGSDTSPFRQSNYYLPLKDAQIAYAANNSAVKNGAANINQASSWTDDSELTYMVLDTDGLGILLDPDHDIEEAEMTEFSLVIAALEAGGRLHDMADLVYQDLGKVALTTAKVELDALLHENTDKTKSELYDVVGRTIINNLKSNKTADLSQEIIAALRGKNFNIHDNHIKDEIKIPFSDPNIYSLILPTFVSIINRKSVKRKYPGSGCVMVPGYGTVLLYYVNGVPHQFQDVAKKAEEKYKDTILRVFGESYHLYLRKLVKAYLSELLAKQPNISIGEFIPTDVANISWVLNGQVRSVAITLDSMDKFVRFKISPFTLKQLIVEQGVDSNGRNIAFADIRDAEFTFQQNVTKGRDLAPARIWWKQNGVTHNIFDVPTIKRNFTKTVTYNVIKDGQLIRRELQIPKSWNIVTADDAVKYLGESPIEDSIKTIETNSTRAEIQEVFDNLEEGFVEENGVRILVEDLHNEAALLVMSNLFKQRFGENSLVDILENENIFYKGPAKPIRALFDYDLVLVDAQNRHSFITFADEVKTTEKSDPKPVDWDQDRIKRVPIRGERGGISSKGSYVYTMDNDNNLLYLIGKEVVTNLNWEDIKNSDEVKRGKYRLNSNNQVVEYIEYISKYRAKDLKKRGSHIHTVYLINVNNLKRGEDRNLLKQLVASLYNQGNYSELRVNTKLPVETLSLLLEALPNTGDTLYSFELTLHLANVKKFLINEAASKITEDSHVLLNWSRYLGLLDLYLRTKAVNMRTSFLRSLKVTASRIPALTLLSFMLMLIAGFTDSEKNICYVSHFQTYLQGSDYDIDKAYIMACEIDRNGKYIGWSPLFNLSTLEYLQASEQLPTPADNTFTYDANSDINITDDIVNILSATGPQKLILEAKLIKKLDKLALRRHTNDLGVNLDISKLDDSIIDDALESAKRKQAAAILRDRKEDVTAENILSVIGSVVPGHEALVKEVFNRVMHRIDMHEHYEIPLELRENAYKNAVSSKINLIILNLRNMDSAYSSVDEEMDTLRNIANNSPKGNLVKSMSLVNPATKFQMLVLNMVGKSVIGISATGEKIFFNLSYYWNEGIRSNDPNWLNLLSFLHEYTRIHGRSTGNPVRRVVDTVANLNMEIPDPLILRDKINEVNDIIKEVERTITNPDDLLPAVLKEIKRRHANVSLADILISALLSAATDNAKELILDRINADSNLAGNYLYLLSIGFSIDDIASFMISPAITVIQEFLNENMFDAYTTKLKLASLIDLLLGRLPKDFIKGYILRETDEGFRESYPLQPFVLDSIAKEIGQETPGNELLNYILARVFGVTNKSIFDIVKDNKVLLASNYIDNIISKLQYEFAKSGEKDLQKNWDNYIADLEEFKLIHQRALEATTLGNVFLSLNQGLPTSEVDLLLKLKSINDITHNREKLLTVLIPTKKGTTTILLKTALEYYKEEDRTPEEKEAYFNAMVKALQDNNPKLEKDYIELTLELAISFGVAGGFDVRTWMNDEEYRAVTRQYFNIIKNTWNIFDVIDKVPHYNSLVRLLTMIYNINHEICIKNKVIDSIHTKLLEETNAYVDEYMLKLLEHYVDDRLIVDWIRKSPNTNFTIPVEAGDTYLNIDFDILTSSTKTEIKLSDPTGISNFKYFVEKYLVPRLLAGRLVDPLTGNAINVADNPFVLGLVLTEDNREIPFYKLDIDMLAVEDSPENLEKFLDFIDGLLKLGGINFLGKPLSDWFIMYNFIVNKNNYGLDRMTTIFKPFLERYNKNNLLLNYYKYISELDYNGKIQQLQEFGIYYEDARMYMAPYKTEYQELSSVDPYIKQSKNGFTIYKKKGKDGYYEVPLIPKRTLLNKLLSEIELEQRLRTLTLYGVLQSPVVNSVEYYRIGLDSTDIDTIINTLGVLTSKGNLLYVIDNCD